MKAISSNDITKTIWYKEIIAGKIACYFISPHLDDAVFSCASLLTTLVRNKVPVTIINVFSRPSAKPYTLSVRKFLWQCGYSDAQKLFRDRIVEDKIAITHVGGKVRNLGFVDALWRRLPIRGLRNFFSNYIGELSSVYPIYRLGLAHGKVSGYDSWLYSEIGKQLIKIVVPGSVIFCPLAIGRHVDHLITRDVCLKYFPKTRVIYWSDYPYETDRPLESEFIKKHNLTESKLMNNSDNKNTLINTYKSQLNVIFGELRDHSNVIEKYYN